MNWRFWLLWKLGLTRFNTKGFCYILNTNGTFTNFKRIGEAMKAFNAECDRLTIQAGIKTWEETDLFRQLVYVPQWYPEDIDTCRMNDHFPDNVTGRSVGFVQIRTERI